MIANVKIYSLSNGDKTRSFLPMNLLLFNTFFHLTSTACDKTCICQNVTNGSHVICRNLGLSPSLPSIFPDDVIEMNVEEKRFGNDILSSISFPPFPNLRRLSIEKCRLLTIEDQAFLNMKSIEVLRLNGNFISQISNQAFEHLTELLELSLVGNRLVSVSGDLFRGLNVNFLDLSGNMIRFLSEEAFDGMNRLKVLNISNNQLQDFSETLFNRIPEIRLERNPFHCNCQLNWLRIWMDQNRRQSADHVICASPSPGLLLSRQPTAFTCTLPNFSYVSPSTSVHEGSNILLQCSAESDPVPTVSFEPPFGGSVTVIPSHTASKTLNRTQTIIMLKNVKQRNSGSYFCNASNIIGQVSTTVILNVLSKDATTTAVGQTKSISAGSKFEHSQSTENIQKVTLIFAGITTPNMKQPSTDGIHQTRDELINALLKDKHELDKSFNITDLPRVIQNSLNATELVLFKSSQADPPTISIDFSDNNSSTEEILKSASNSVDEITRNETIFLFEEENLKKTGGAVDLLSAGSTVWIILSIACITFLIVVMIIVIALMLCLRGQTHCGRYRIRQSLI